MTISVAETQPEGTLVFRTIHPPLTAGATVWPSGERVVTILDARFPSGCARLLAWDVKPLGYHDMSSWLCRCNAGEYFLLRRPDDRLEAPHAVVHISPEQASAWYAKLAIRVGSWTDPREHVSATAPNNVPSAVAD